MELGHGAIVAGHRIEARIGEGPVGSVHAARDPEGRRVAVKILDADAAADARERFTRDARHAAAIGHPHVLPVHATGDTADGAFVAMRLVEAGSLARVLAAGGPLGAERAVRICGQAAEALDAAHAHGLVHADVKPTNVLVERGPEGEHAYVADFGAARHGFGTVGYLAPEQAEGRPVHGRADVYALACVLFECLAGRPPFVRDNDLATLIAHRSEPPPPLADRRPDLPPAVDPVMARALAKDPAERHESCGALMADVRAALGGMPIAPATATAGSPAPHTFVFADIRGYTAYTREHGDEVSARMIRQFTAIVEPLATAHGGTVTQYRGDEALVVFESPRAALRFALDLQRRVAEEALPCGVGVGLDAGEAVPIGVDFHGTALNRAARLCSIARAGEVLATDGVLHLAGQADGVRYGLRRLERLKGFAQPVGVNEIHSAGTAPPRQLRRRLGRRLRGTHPRVRLGATGALVALAAATVAVVAASGGGGGATASAFEPNSIALLNARTGAPEGTAAPGLQICVFATAGNDVWACDADQSILLRVDARSRRVVDQLPLPVFHGSFTIGFGSAWVGDAASPSVRRVSIRYRTSSPPIRLPGVPARSPTGETESVDSMVTAKGRVWAAYGFPKRIARIDPATDRVTFSAPLPQSCPCHAWLAADGDRLWAVGGDGVHVYRLDPHTGRTLATGRLHKGEVAGVAAARGYLWVAVQGDDAVWKIDETGSIVDTVPTGHMPYDLAAGGGYLWVPNSDDGTVTRIDPATDATRTYRVGHRPLAVAELKGTLFVGLGQSAREAAAGITGPKVVRVMAPDFAGAVDPVSIYQPGDLVLGLATGAGLMSARTDASGRTTVAPELAAGPPAVSNGGRTYAFTVRRDARFSSGARVTAQAVRSSIERAVDPKQLNTYCHDLVLHDVAGEGGYESGRADHVSGLRASGDRLAITLVRPDATLPARLANPCLSVVPPGTPVSPGGLEHPIPSAGPYAVASFVRFEQVVLRPNRFYDGPRRPALDALIVKGGMTGESAAAAVEHGAADYMADTGMPPSGDLQPGSAVARRYGRPGGRLRYLRPPSPATMMLILDTRRGLFSNVRLRRAVNLALDRRALAGFGHADPRSLLIPPGVPGHSTAGPYPVRPDLRRARALAAGHHGTVVVAADAGGPAGSADPVLEEMRRDLARIGITAKVVLRANPVAASTHPRQHIDAVFTGWAPDYPDPFDAIDVVLDPAARPAGLPAFFDDARWLRRMRRAAATPQARRAAVYGRLDRALALGPAPVAVLGGPPGVPQLVSSRLGCLAFVFGRLDLSSICVRG